MANVNDIVRVWSSDRYKSVMLPGLGTMTCGEASEKIRKALEDAIKDDSKNDR